MVTLCCAVVKRFTFPLRIVIVISHAIAVA
jgi:hypothetical protein